MGYSHQGHVMMPARPGTGFVVPHTQVSFTFFKEFLNAPANPGDLCQGLEGDMGIGIADVVFDFRLGLQGTADQEPTGRAGLTVADLPDTYGGEFKRQGAFGSTAELKRLPGRRRQRLDDLSDATNRVPAWARGGMAQGQRA